MARSNHWLDIMKRIREMRLDEAVLAARRNKALAEANTQVAAACDVVAGTIKKLSRDQERSSNLNRIAAAMSAGPLPAIDHLSLEQDRQRLDKLLQAQLADPMHPENWHRRLTDEQLAMPETAAIYFKVRQALWSWPEFATVSRGAMAILHVVCELARDEAFPWYVAVPAEHVRRLARMSTRHYTRTIQELDCLAITRPARIIQIAGRDGLPQFPGSIDLTEPCDPIAQWVVRYRRGYPHNRKRAAWWINYDLLCRTNRVHRCFVFSSRTLNKVYQSRNRVLGPHRDSWAVEKSDDGFAALNEMLSRGGPIPPLGLRTALWRDAILEQPSTEMLNRE